MLISLILAGLLIVIGQNVWASPKDQPTVPPVALVGGQTCPYSIDMDTALFTCFTGDMLVERVVDLELYPPAPDGLTFVGDLFKATTIPEGELLEVCYAYPTEFADKEAKIYKLNEASEPPTWEEVPGAEISDGQICVTTTAGIFSLIGQP